VSFDEEAQRDADVASAATDAPGNEAFGRYVGQINARIDRAWLRPRSPISADRSAAKGFPGSANGATWDDRFVCRVRIAQDSAGKVTEVTLEHCNGSPRWQLSLVHAIESASPLPVPPDPSVFAHVIHMRFEASAVESAASVEQYEPAGF